MNNGLAAHIQSKNNFRIPQLLLSAAFKEQSEFILDPARRKAALVARRSGKSFMVGIYLLYEALTKPKTKSLYFGKTQYTSKNIMWLHIILNLCERFNIQHKYNKSLQEITLTNGSVIKMTGADASDGQIEKALGGKYRLVIFDECQVISHDLERWINDRLGPAMIDEQGTICCLGTAGDYMGEHYWYKITRTEGAREPGWKVYSWPWTANIHMKDKIEKEINEMLAYDANIMERPGFRREYLCQWVEPEGRCYHFDDTKNVADDPILIKSLLDRDPKWKYIIGMDFGYEDDNAITVGAFSKHDPICYIVDSYKQNHMQIDEIAELMLQWRDKYKPIHIVGDAQDKIVIETLRQKHRIPILAAEKLGKFAHIANMNSDFAFGKIKIIAANNRALIKEWNELIWDEKQRVLGNFKENSSKANHLADSALYLHHFSKHFRATPEPIISEQEHRMRMVEEKYKRQHNYNQDSWTDLREYIDNQDFVQEYKKGM